MNGVGTRKRLGKSSSMCKKCVLWEVVEMPFANGSDEPAASTAGIAVGSCVMLSEVFSCR